jgi:hypothetical protein
MRFAPLDFAAAAIPDWRRATMPTEFNPLVSFYSDAFENLPTDIPAADFIASIKSGNYAGKIKVIRQRVQNAIARGVPYEDAKKAVDSHKKKLAAITLAGIQPMRGNKFVPQFTGLIQADFDLLGDKLKSIRDLLADDPHVFCAFISATGEGLKAWYRIPICKNADEYKFAFDTLAKHVLQFTGCKIDELKEVARLCYASHDPDCFHNPNAIELPMDFAQMPSPAAKPFPSKSPALNGESRRAAAEKLVGKIEHTDTGDFCKCPGEHLHTNGNAPKDCRVTLDGVPTIFCLHRSCSQVIETANHELRSQIAKAEFVPTRTPQSAPRSNRAEIAAEYLGGENAADHEAKVTFTIRTPDEILDMVFNDDDIIVGDRIIAEAQSCVFVAAGGLGKSRISLQIPACVVTGRKFLNFTTGNENLNWLFLQTENS